MKKTASAQAALLGATILIACAHEPEFGECIRDRDGQVTSGACLAPARWCAAVDYKKKPEPTPDMCDLALLRADEDNQRFDAAADRAIHRCQNARDQPTPCDASAAFARRREAAGDMKTADKVYWAMCANGNEAASLFCNLIAKHHSREETIKALTIGCESPTSGAYFIANSGFACRDLASMYAPDDAALSSKYADLAEQRHVDARAAREAQRQEYAEQQRRREERAEREERDDAEDRRALANQLLQMSRTLANGGRSENAAGAGSSPSSGGGSGADPCDPCRFHAAKLRAACTSDKAFSAGCYCEGAAMHQCVADTPGCANDVAKERAEAQRMRRAAADVGGHCP